MRSIYEDVYFYLDLTKDYLRKKDIVKAVKYLIQEKSKKNTKGRYGLLLFQEGGNPVFVTDKKDEEIILNVIDENWKSRPKKSLFENGLFYIFSFIAEKVRKKSKMNRVIIITDTPSDLNEEYQEALFNLVSKIKYFPTFIDIIRVSEEGQRFFKDDGKLNILASDTKGGIFYVQDKKEFRNIIEKLVKSKQLVPTYSDRPDQIEITQDDYKFYSRLAKKLRRPKENQVLECILCKEKICPVCADIKDVPYICEKCGAAFHECCVINYTINNNIGIPHIFRCPKCELLLQIDEDSIIQVKTEDTEEDDQVQVISVKDYMGINSIKISENNRETIDKGSSDEIKIISETKKDVGKKDYITPQREDPKETKVRIGGYFGKLYTVKKSADKVIYQVSDSLSKLSQNTDVDKDNNYWKPTKSSETVYNASESQKSFKVTICPICGTQLQAKAEYCQNCGHKINS
ncbi:MAG: zinc-ribbon domain-containing protein [Candidatus Lokiarchaeota archaeon]|nr:zinc-ribbon domain-containing protein [Candidatus Lokiarchaeota archaeon]MBD3342344.1 zinc-ribbon domain-containing protein [Candidatus Lokiarchaeota archaeon]